jgi:hypothetical protein
MLENIFNQLLTLSMMLASRWQIRYHSNQIMNGALFYGNHSHLYILYIAPFFIVFPINLSLYVFIFCFCCKRATHKL